MVFATCQVKDKRQIMYEYNKIARKLFLASRLYDYILR